MDRRKFLKISAATTGIAFMNPLQVFSSLGDMYQANVDGDGKYFNLGFGQISIGSSSAFIGNTDRCLKKNIGLAAIKFRMPDDCYESLTKAETALQCSFQKKPVISGSIGRVEACFVYPNGINAMTVILPKAKMRVSGGDFYFTALPVSHRAWKDMPFGRIVFE